MRIKKKSFAKLFTALSMFILVASVFGNTSKAEAASTRTLNDYLYQSLNTVSIDMKNDSYLLGFSSDYKYEHFIAFINGQYAFESNKQNQYYSYPTYTEDGGKTLHQPVSQIRAGDQFTVKQYNDRDVPEVVADITVTYDIHEISVKDKEISVGYNEELIDTGKFDVFVNGKYVCGKDASTFNYSYVQDTSYGKKATVAVPSLKSGDVITVKDPNSATEVVKIIVTKAML